MEEFEFWLGYFAGLKRAAEIADMFDDGTPVVIIVEAIKQEEKT